jgi:galactokinase
MKNFELEVSAPGRLCLFGEHQDYFGLCTIAAAINLRIFICGKKRKDKKFKIRKLDIGEEDEFSLEKELSYHQERDYLRSVVNIIQREGIHLSSGWNCVIRGNIPINAGSAGSSALVVAWIKYLLEAHQAFKHLAPEKIAELGFLAEVAEFKEPGGKMDHYSSSLGGVLCIHFDENLRFKKIKNPLKEFVLADSLQKKDTTGMLGYIKGHVLRGVSSVNQKISNFNLKSPLTPEVQQEIEKLPSEEKKLLYGTLLTRDLTKEGENLFEADEFDHTRFGQLLSLQQGVLRDYLHISTPKIEEMIESSLQAGALGAKINGSGGGGCIFAYTPENAEQVAESLRKLGAKTYIIRIDEGVRTES